MFYFNKVGILTHKIIYIIFVPFLSDCFIDICYWGFYSQIFIFLTSCWAQLVVSGRLGTILSQLQKADHNSQSVKVSQVIILQ